MAQFLISYDLKKAKNYPPLWAMLERAGAVRLLESLWLAALNTDAAATREALQTVTDGDDAVVVIELKPGSAWSTTCAKLAGTTWLADNIRRYLTSLAGGSPLAPLQERLAA